MIEIALTAAGAAAMAGAGALMMQKRKAGQATADIESECARTVAEARAEASDITDKRLAQAREKAATHRTRLRKEMETWRKALDEEAERLETRETGLATRQTEIDTREADLAAQFDAFSERRDSVRARRGEGEAAIEQVQVSLEHRAGMTRTEGMEVISKEMIHEARILSRKAARAMELQADAGAEQRARHLIDIAGQRYGDPLPTERLIATVSLPDKGKAYDRLMAGDGALFAALAEATEVEFVPTDDPGTLLMQAPDPFTREIGRLTYLKMLKARKLDEAAVARLASECSDGLYKVVRKAGRKAARILKVGQVHPDILELVGKLLYRTSYTQNQWQHAIETAFLCGMMADELGMDVTLARRAALMHDIGKVLWAETEAVGSHAVSGAAFARERKEDPDVIHAIAAHHNDEKPSTPLAHLVAAADALSGARPGARREMLESYTSRVDDLERISSDFKGVDKFYVISGGRELRLHVDHRKVDDLAAAQLSGEVARRIEEECIYPGQIKVTVIRELKASATAR